MKFTDYRHFKFYSLKIAKNKNIAVSQSQVSSFDHFESFYNELLELEQDGYIKIDDDFLDKICDMFRKEHIVDSLSHMDYFVRKFKKVKNNEVDFYYIITSLKTIFNIEIEFQQKSISENFLDNRVFHNRVPIIEILAKEEKIFTISNLDFNYNNRFGVYFLYDSNKELSYIGKSANCILTRSLNSVRERGLTDFSKIELYKTKTRSDVAIYEAYYISKFKPSCNKDIVFDDFPTIELPDLKIDKLIARNPDRDFKQYKYVYIKKSIVNLDELTDIEKENLIIYNTDNFNYFLKKGYKTEHDAKNEIFSKEIAEIRDSEGLAISDIYELRLLQ